MRDPQSLLVEIGVEELPVQEVDHLARAFAKAVCDGLAQRGVAADTAQARVYCTPRRLAVLVPAVAARQPEQRRERVGPYTGVALDAAGLPTKALLGFAGKAGVDWQQLERTRDTRGERFVYRSTTPGRATVELVPAIVREAAAGLPVQKPMRWGDHDFTFVRPVHWLVMLHGDQVVDGELFEVAGGRQSRGHRFLHPGPVHLADADSYVDALRVAKVLVDPSERRERIRRDVENAARGLGSPQLDDALLDELANLNEWPVAIACAFDRAYLAVPHEALVTTMRTKQTFIPVLDAAGELSEHFIGVANIESKDPAQVRQGYERVIRPRFADAKYFFDEDLKTPLAAHQQGLSEVVWQRALGSLWDKTARVAELARAMAGGSFGPGIEVDAAAVARAAGLSRCDLLTRMVGEFPELQGVMGRHYADAQDEAAGVATALDEFYRPRHAGDRIANGALGQCLALADRLDTLAGIFALGLKPTGNKDPFALRRAALGLARTLIEGQLDLDVVSCFERAVELVYQHLRNPPVARHQATGAQRVRLTDRAVSTVRRARRWATMEREVYGETEELYLFVLDRLRGYYADQGFVTQQFDAVAAVRPASLVDFDRRLRAVAAFAGRPEAARLAAANKRVANILRKEGIDQTAAAMRATDAALVTEPAEQTLVDALRAAEADNAPRLAGDTVRRDYAGALARLAELQVPIDAFFGAVMVMAEDPALRANRVALLAQVKARFDAVADVALL